MIAQWKSFLTVLTLAVLFCSSTAVAIPDPEAENQAWAMYRAVSASEEQFQSLFEQDPGLTKRAFIYTLSYMAKNIEAGNLADAESAGEFAYLLADKIEKTFQDPIPMLIVNGIQNSDPETEDLLLSYAESLYQDFDGSMEPSSELGEFVFYGENKMRAEQIPSFHILKPLFIKLMRTTLALAFSDPKLVLQELGTFEPVLDELKQSVISLTGEIDQETELYFEDTSDQIELAKLDVMAELGLLQEFDSRALELVASQEDAETRIGIYFTGFRVAYRQEQYDKAEVYLKKAQKELGAHSSEISPILKFVERTAQYQLRLVEGKEPTPEETLQAFARAWSVLESYRPLKKMSDDIAWIYGRYYSRFWVEHLASLGPTGENALETIINSSLNWMQTAIQFEGLEGLSVDNVLLRFEELQGPLTVTFTSIDVLLLVFEERPELLSDSNADLKDLDLIPVAVAAYAELAEGLNLNPGGPGFPPYSLAENSQIRQFQVRVNYLKGFDTRKDDEQRLAALETVLPQLEDIDLPDLYIDYHIKLGQAFKDLNRGDLAVAAWEKALKKAEQLSFTTRSIDSATLLAEEYGAREDWQKAGFYAAKANQGLKDELGASEGAAGLSLTQKTSSLTALGAKAAIKSNEPQKALALLSEGQQMNSASVQISGNKEAAAATKKLQSKKRQVATLTQQVQTLQNLPESSTRNEMIQKTETLLAESKSDFLLQSRNIRQKFSRIYTSALRFDPLNLPDIQSALQANTAVVQYFPTDEELYIFVVTQDQFRLRSVGQKKDALDLMVIDYLKTVQQQNSQDSKLGEISRRLYQTLLAPIEEDLADSKVIILIPTGKLNVLPFAALTDASGQMLVDKKTLLELAKPTDFMKIAVSRSKPISSVVTFANATEDLPAAEREGKNITELFPNSKLFTREQASKANLMKFGSEAEVLHLATHGVWDAGNSLNNHLKLSNDEELAQEEIFDLNLEQTSIVTLSACSTALADNNDVDYIASLAEAFWIAGSRSVVASLWPVDDDSTEVLMTKFYQHLKDGKGKAEALQLAQIQVRDNPRFAHPYYWSGFILFGDYR